MLSFRLTNEGKSVQIDCDDRGVETLLAALQKLQQAGGHVHLLSPSCGGHELSDETPWGDQAVGEVTITWVGD
jgi:hypothetical protein